MTDDKTLRAECEKAWSAYRIAHDQAMSNGQALQEALAENQSLSDRIAVTELDGNGEAMMCEGCGTTKTLAAILAQHGPKAIACCPERKMVNARYFWERASLIKEGK